MIDIKPMSKSIVFIIEDDVAIRESMADCFDGKYEVVECRDGQEALNRLREARELPCIIFLDLMMPGMNGWDFLSAVEAMGILGKLQIVILSAASGDLNIPHHITYLRKPMDLPRLEELCNLCCSIKEGSQASTPIDLKKDEDER